MHPIPMKTRQTKLAADKAYGSEIHSVRLTLPMVMRIE